MKHLLLQQYFAQWPTLWWLLIGQTTQKAGFPELIRGHFSLNTKFSLFHPFAQIQDLQKYDTYMWPLIVKQGIAKILELINLGTWWLSRSFKGFYVVEYIVLLYLYFFVSLYLSFSLSPMIAYFGRKHRVQYPCPNYPSYSHGHSAHYRKEIVQNIQNRFSTLYRTDLPTWIYSIWDAREYMRSIPKKI